MSFIATGGPTASPDTETIPNAAWWPDVSMQAFRAASRIDRTAPDEQVRTALVSAISNVNAQLNGWLGNQLALNTGATKLADLPDPPGQAEGWYAERYLRAVHSAADALLTESYRDFDSTAEGHQRADAMEGRIDAYRRESQYAIADITGRPRRRVELL